MLAPLKVLLVFVLEAEKTRSQIFSRLSFPICSSAACALGTFSHMTWVYNCGTGVDFPGCQGIAPKDRTVSSPSNFRVIFCGYSAHQSNPSKFQFEVSSSCGNTKVQAGYRIHRRCLHRDEPAIVESPPSANNLRCSESPRPSSIENNRTATEGWPEPL